MHCRLAAAWIGILGLLGAAPVQGQAVDSEVERVTIFPGELARIERVARIERPDAAGSLVFEGLPSALIGASVGVAVESGNARLGSVETRREPVGEPTQARRRELEERIDELESRRRAALDRATAAQSQITFIEGLAELPRGKGAPQALTASQGRQDWTELFERIGSRSRAAHKRLREAEAEAEGLKNQIETLQRKLRQLGGDRPERVTVRVQYDDAHGPLVVRLRYRVRGPRWTPTYAARLDTEAGEVTLVRRAVVRQATGEDWRDVALRLSTVQPVRGDRPTPEPWWIQLAPEQAGYAESTLSADSGEAASRSKGAGAQQKAPARTRNAEFAATYAVAGRITLPAGNDPREVALGEETLAASIGVEVFAQQDPRAWLTAETTWRGAGPLPPGSLTRYRDGAFVGEGRVDGWAPGESRTLAFGTDPRVEVRFQPVRDAAGESGWITSKSTRARQYELVVANRHTREVPVKALFRVPVPRNEAITVETDFSAPPTSRDVEGKRGVHAWEATIDADEKRTWSLGYKVTYPAERELRGL